MTELFQRESSAIIKPDDKAPLMSVIIISYNNTNFLHHAVKSVLAQNYKNIELTISDDATVSCTIDDIAHQFCLATADLTFEEKHPKVAGIDRNWKKHKCVDTNTNERFQNALEEWEQDLQGGYEQAAIEIVKDSFPNIRKVEFLRNKENLGTVKHLKSLKKNAAGKYVMFLAADDMLHDSYVISDLVTYFETLPEDAYVLSSQCGMYDENLDKLNYYAVNEELKDIITKSTPEELFAELTDWCIIPAAGTIYKKDAFEVFGDLDDQYHLIEDWTYFLKLTRSGGKVYYLDRLTYMHRDGGISHGNNSGGNLAYKYYLEDSILLTQQEILPYLNQITSQQKKRALKRYRDTRREYGRMFMFPEMNVVGKLFFFLRNGYYYIPKLLSGLLAFFDYRAKWCLVAGTGALFASFLLSLAPTQGDSQGMLYYLFGLMGLALVSLALITKGLFISSRAVKAVKSLLCKL